MNLNISIQNGELVTIISNKFKIFQSIRFKLFFSFIVIGLISTVVLSFVFLTTINQRYLTERKKELYRQANTIAISLVTTGYFSEENDKSYLSTIQASVPGRGLIIGRTGRVLFDSNYLDQGKVYSSKEIMDGLLGSSSYHFVAQENTGIVTVPIMDRDFNSVLGVVIVSDSFDDISESTSYFINITVFIAIALILLTIILSYYFSGAFNKPFRQLIEHMNKVTDGHIEEQIEISGNSEVREISTAFNTMISKLEAIESNRQQFVANVSHELKTPLSSVKVLAEALLHQPDVPIEIYQDFLQDINHEVDRENKIINDLLTLVTIDKKDNALQIEEVVINNLIEQVMKRLKPIADKKNVEMVFESYRVVIAEIDETKMSLVLTNLIENAIKYNRDEGFIFVSLDTDYKDFIIIVRDTGEGIPEDNLDKVFRRFYRVDKTRSRETGGTGLGLSIVQKSVHSHNGTIVCDSELGEWTEFVMRIPLKQTHQKGKVTTNES